MKPLAPERVALLKAAELLEQRGWVQGTFENGAGMCVERAINRVSRNHSDFYAAHSLLCDVLSYAGVMGMREYNAVMVWNDHHCRTKDEVVSTLRAAAVHGL